MKIKGLILAITTVGLLFLSSCSGGYSCPTYAQETEENSKTLVKEYSSELEINS